MTQTDLPTEPAVHSSPSVSHVDARYGRARQRGIDRKFGWIAGAALILGGAVFFAFSGWQQGSNIEFSDISYEVRSPTEVTARFDVTAPAGSSVACAVEALSTSFSTVGWKVLELPVSTENYRTFSETVLTTYPATTATVRSCWIMEQPE